MLATIDRADEIASSTKLRDFMVHTFPIVDKSTKFQDSWFYGVVCEYAQAFIDGEIKRLLSIQPPGTYKSGLWSVCVPAYAWLKYPWMKFIVASNEKTLVTELSEKSQTIIKSDWYKSAFRPPWAMKTNIDALTFFANSETGARRGVSTGASIVGKKAHRIIVDDLHDAKKVHSVKVRKNDKEWFRKALYDRVTNFKEGGIAVVGHRTHKDDIQSELMAEGWETLHIPERWEEQHRRPYIYGGYATDPRQEGEYLRPESFGPNEERATRLNDEYKWQTSHQGDPKTAQGTMFPPDKWRPIIMPEIGTKAIRFWDTAASITEGSSWTCGVLIGRQPSGRFCVIDVKRVRARPFERDSLIESTCWEDQQIPGVDVETCMEHPGGSGGVQAAEILLQRLTRFVFRIISVSSKGSKLYRAGPVSSQQTGGNFDIVVDGGSWQKGYKERMEIVHDSTEQDDMDATSGAYNELVQGTFGDGVPVTGESLNDNIDTDRERQIHDGYLDG